MTWLGLQWYIEGYTTQEGGVWNPLSPLRFLSMPALQSSFNSNISVTLCLNCMKHLKHTYLIIVSRGLEGAFAYNNPFYV